MRVVLLKSKIEKKKTTKKLTIVVYVCLFVLPYLFASFIYNNINNNKITHAFHTDFDYYR